MSLVKEAIYHEKNNKPKETDQWQEKFRKSF